MKTDYKILFIKAPHSSLPSLDKVNEKLQGNIRLTEVETLQLDSDINPESEGWQTVANADFILLFSHGSITFFRQFERFWQTFAAEKPIFFHSTMEDEVEEMTEKFTISHKDYRAIYKYMAARDVENIYRLAHYIAHHFGGMDTEVQEPFMPAWEGIYKDIDVTKKSKETRIIGLLFHQRQIALNDLQHIDALIHEIERAGSRCIAVYCTLAADMETGEKGVFASIEKYFRNANSFIPDVIINLLGYSLGIFDGEGALFATEKPSAQPLKRIGIPIIQAYTTYFNYDQWKTSVQGLDAFSLISSIYYPEFDGQMDGYPIGCMYYCEAEKCYKSQPLHEGISVVARLAQHWANLRHKPDEEKKVAIIFHNMPPRNDMIGCAAGLDSPASVFNLVESLRAMGVSFQNRYKDGDEIISRVIEGLSNDTSWLSTKEILKRAPAFWETADYKKLYQHLEQETRKSIEKHWGEAPGTFKVLGEKIPIPGILDRHLYIGLQPPRGYEEHADEAYHSTDIACPHYYVAFYKWLKYDFQADVVIHIGTHGTLEWLPGKEKGLSKACLPLVCIDDIPHLYLYHTTVIGEGIQAKRRSAAVLLNHLEPTSVESGTYGKLSEIDQRIHKYLSAPIPERQKKELAEQILLQAEKMELLKDIGVDSIDHADIDAIIYKLHAWLGIIKQSQVKDGLHIYGEAPTEERLLNFLRVLVRTSNGETPSITEALADYMHLSYPILKKEPNHVWEDGKTSIMLMDEITEMAKKLVVKIGKEGFRPLSKTEITEVLGPCAGTSESIEKVVAFIANVVYPKVIRTDKEIAEFEDGMGGLFVSAGKGGSPSRGNIEILPTGNNMYAIDPSEVPSRAAYKTGKEMGEQLLQRYLDDSGTYPESVAIVLYSGDQMRSYGEDIGEILWLMGLKPKWLGNNSDKVLGVEIVPITKLGRPRIDVVSRISGLLRDTFPSIINLLDEAVKAVITLDEKDEENFIKKHYNEDLASLLQKGIHPDTAKQEAGIRVFGCPPGTYGGGVDILVEAKNWRTDDDLATAAITWGAHAYSKDVHGAVSKDNFRRQLAKVDVTVKNDTTIDFDLFDVDDEFIYHGGLIAAVKQCSGKRPASFYGNSSDPEFVSLNSLKEESARVMRARLLNPIWIDGLKRHSYKGAQDVAYNMDNIFGWDATADIVEDWNYEELAKHFLGNEENKKWLEDANPWALREIAEKLLEAYQRGMWNAKEDTLDMVQNIYLETEGLLEENR